MNFTEVIPLKSITLSSMSKREQIDLTQYDALVMDTQGSELLVLKGATDILDRFRFIKTEAADFEVYKGCCTLADLDDFLRVHHFRRIRKKSFAHKSGVGSCYDVLLCPGLKALRLDISFSSRPPSCYGRLQAE